MPVNSDANHQADRLRQAIEMIDAAQIAGLSDPNPDHACIKAIRDFFECDGCIFIQPDHNSKGLATKKEIGSTRGWKITSGIPFHSGLLYATYKENVLKEINDPQGYTEYDQSVDGLTHGEAQFLVSNAIQSHTVKFGVLALINPRNYFMNTQDRLLLHLFSTALAGQLHTTSVLAELQVKDADLQVNRIQLLKSRNILRSIFDNLPDALFVVDPDFIIRAVNKTKADLVGMPPQELVGKRCYEVFYGAEKPCLECLVPETIRTRQSQRTLAHHRESQQDRNMRDVFSYPVINEENQVELVILLEQDVTEKRELMSELNQAEKLIAAGQLAASVAHEINNPLTAILANAQMLRLDLKTDQTDLLESVQLIEMAAQRAKNVVDNLSGIVRKDEYVFHPVDINESIQSALQLVSHEFLSRKITIRFTGGENMPELLASHDHLQGVWINLLLNAIEAIGEQPGEIMIETLFNEGKYYIEFRDTGEGISDEDLDKIFTPFFSTKKKKKGTGLGLTLVSRIIHSHAGQILVESTPGQGARFTIVLPARTPEEVKASGNLLLDVI